MASLSTSEQQEDDPEAMVKAFPKRLRQNCVAKVGKSIWKSYSWAQRWEVIRSSSSSSLPETKTSSTSGGPGASKTCGDTPRCYLCIDIDNARAKFARCQDFVEAKSLAYNLSSPKLAELGGCEHRFISAQTTRAKPLLPRTKRGASKNPLGKKAASAAGHNHSVTLTTPQIQHTRL